MEKLKLEAGSAALVLIDLQHAVVSRETAPYSAAEAVAKGAALAKAFREKKAAVVYVRVNLNDFSSLPTDAPRMAMEDAPAIYSELVPESGVQAEDTVITKRFWGAFGGTELEAKLRKAGVTTVVIGGIATNFGVESTAREAAGLGFAVVVVEDASTGLDAGAHKFAFETIFPRLGRVRKTAEVVDALA